MCRGLLLWEKGEILASARCGGGKDCQVVLHVVKGGLRASAACGRGEGCELVLHVGERRDAS